MLEYLYIEHGLFQMKKHHFRPLYWKVNENCDVDVAIDRAGLTGLDCKCFLVFFPVSWLAILILLAYMAMVIVILLNILIAQLSYTYSEAKKTAKLQYAIDTMFIVTRLEYSRIARWVRT